MSQKMGLSLHLWFIALGSLFIIATWSGPRIWVSAPWMATCLVSALAAVTLNLADRRARRRWAASLAAAANPAS
jgi:hypothetical protein